MWSCPEAYAPPNGAAVRSFLKYLVAIGLFVVVVDVARDRATIQRLIRALIVGGILNKDFPLVQGTVLFVATVYVLINLLVDVAYAYADPRIRFG